MKKIISIISLSLLLVISCTKNSEEETVRLQKDTPEYQLAQDLAAILPALDPEKNKVLVTSKNFDITSGEVVLDLKNQLGKRSNTLKSSDSLKLKAFIEKKAQEIGENKLVLQKAKENEIEVTDNEVDSLINIVYERFGGKESYMSYINQNEVKLDIVKGNLRDGLRIRKYFAEVVYANIEITDEELKDIYMQEHTKDKNASVRHILLSTTGKTEEQKRQIRKKMEGLLKQAKEGQDFAALAKKYTEDPGSKNNGGLYANFERGEMVKPFDEAAFSVPIGSISDIVETEFGYHILKIIDRKKDERTFDEQRAQLENNLRKERENVARAIHLASLKQKQLYQIYNFVK
jgi:foldase protein PrsA